MTQAPNALRHLPNALSALRLLAAPTLVVLALYGASQAFTVLLLAALLTDIADGWLARRWRLQSALGATLDSAADVATLAAAAFGIHVFHPAVYAEHGVGCAIVLGGWMLEAALALLRYGRLSSFHTYASKAAGYALGFFLAALFVFGFSAVLFYGAVAISTFALIEELALLWMLPAWRSDVRGLAWVLKERG